MRRLFVLVLIVASLATVGSAQSAVKESYIHIQIQDRTEIGTLTRIANVQGHDVWAFERYLVNGNELDRMWTANRSAMLSYIENALTGVRGLVTDTRGRPLRASVRVVGLPSLGAGVTSDDAVGDYHRMLLPGAYRLQFSADGYAPVERDVIVPVHGSVRVDVVLAY